MSAEPRTGRIAALCLGPGGIPKSQVDAAVAGELGLEGDAHRYHLHGGADRAVCILSIETLRGLEADDVRPLVAGDFGENLLTEGLDLASLRPGCRLEVGDEVCLEITDVREPCQVLEEVDARFPDLLVGRSGWLARVLETGLIRRGDVITTLSPKVSLRSTR